MAKYRKKPVEIEAMQLTRENAPEVAAWCGGRVIEESKPGDPTDRYIAVEIPTLEGVMRAESFHPSTWDPATLRYVGGDYVIRGVQGEFYPCKPDIFASTYDEAPELPTEPETYESYEVYVDSGPAHDRFRAFAETLGRAIELNWRDTMEV